MKFIPMVAVLLTGLLFTPSVNAATVVSTPAPVLTGSANVYIPEPYVPPVREQLRFLGYKASKNVYTSPTSNDRKEIKRFQSKFNLPQSGKMDKRTVKALDKYAGSAQLPKRCVTGEFTLCVNKFNRTVMAVNADGTVAKVMDSRFGKQGYETREGKFTVIRKGGANHISTLYRVEMPHPLFFSGGQAIHYSHEFARLPNSGSHGCVGTRDYNTMKWVWERSPVGTPVFVFDSPPR
jgi:peptidoglycan hydrolase-like protein with peptidoglycan-binding domain